MIETGRLLLRRWEPRDRAPFAALNADPEVMRHFPKRLTRSESDAMIGRLEDRWAGDGFCFAAAERRADGAFVGMVGLARVPFALPLTPDGAVEVGWRLARAHWGRGYASEAARAWLGWGFATLGPAEVVAFAGAGQPSLAGGDAPARDAAGPGAVLRPSEARRGASAAAAPALRDRAGRLGRLSPKLWPSAAPTPALDAGWSGRGAAW